MKDIPEGYTYTRCDQYSAEEFLEHYTSDRMRELCTEYIRDNPKEVYNTDDEIELHKILAARETPGLLHAMNRCTTKRTWYRDR